MAMQFAYGPVAGEPGSSMIYASGKVVAGDNQKLLAALGALPSGAHLIALSINSPGGDAEEGVRLANTVHEKALSTAVGQGTVCASACFNVFAAGRHRFAHSTALIGVHGASVDGKDEPYAEAVTVRLPRQLSSFGVPDAILGKMITTRPDQIWWLTRADLQSMDADPELPQATAKPVAFSSPAVEGVSAAAPAIAAAANPDHKLAFQVLPATRGYALLPRPAGGYQVWSPTASR